MKNKYITLILSVFFIVYACDEKMLEPITSSKGKPGQVTDVHIEPVPGGAVISYKIPNVSDILGVKAVYTLSSGKTYEATSSFYENKLEVLGYIDTMMHDVQIITFNRALEQSDPLKVSFKPKEAPLNKVVKTVRAVSTRLCRDYIPRKRGKI